MGDGAHSSAVWRMTIPSSARGSARYWSRCTDLEDGGRGGQTVRRWSTRAARTGARRGSDGHQDAQLSMGLRQPAEYSARKPPHRCHPCHHVRRPGVGLLWYAGGGPRVCAQRGRAGRAEEGYRGSLPEARSYCVPIIVKKVLEHFGREP